VPALRCRARGVIAGRSARSISVLGRGTGVAQGPRMPPEPPPPNDPSPDATVHQFTVQRGMAIAIVIETRDWYLGLLQAAMARIRLEGQN
jgi:hypothetical protein